MRADRVECPSIENGSDWHVRRAARLCLWSDRKVLFLRRPSTVHYRRALKPEEGLKSRRFQWHPG